MLNYIKLYINIYNLYILTEPGKVGTQEKVAVKEKNDGSRRQEASER
jgi:hypothetical protein